MDEIRKTDYLKFIFNRTRTDLTRYDMSSSDKELINKLFEKLIHSDNLLIDLYMLSHIKELKSIGKYFVFIMKKIEDNVISFENLSQNIDADTGFIKAEILNYLSNPEPRESTEYKYRDEITNIIDETSTPETDAEEEEIYNEETKTLLKEPEEQIEEEEISTFKKNYLELIQSESKEDEETVYQLPGTESEQIEDPGEIVFELPKIENEEIKEDEIKVGVEHISDGNIEDNNPIAEDEDEKNDEQILFKKDEKLVFEDESYKQIDDEGVEKKIEEQRIQFSDEFQKELILFEEEQKKAGSEESIFNEEELQASNDSPTNAVFIEYENEVKEKNEYLNKEFDSIINLVNAKSESNDERSSIIKNIVDTSTHLESISRKMSLEIISNIYHTITLSFEKISDGKYDISEGTVNLFKSGLSLIVSLIKGDDYFSYKDILKSIENIRNALLEETEKRELYLKQQKEKQELEKRLSQKYPDDSQRVKITLIKQLIKDTETKFNSLDNISGEYQIYEALRSLSATLTNFKEIVLLSKELQMTKLVQLAEAGYIFVKFLQNYRINPVTIETKEIFGYVIYNLKSFVVGKEVEDVDLFISYLNDPVKIFSKKEKKKT